LTLGAVESYWIVTPAFDVLPALSLQLPEIGVPDVSGPP
jgi:hypothetical protein